MDEENRHWTSNHAKNEWRNQNRNLPSRASVPNRSMRIDMASMLNEAPVGSIEYKERRSVIKDSDTSEESKFYGEEDVMSEGGAVCVLSRPCLCTTACVAFLVAAVFAAGIGTGIATRTKNLSPKNTDTKDPGGPDMQTLQPSVALPGGMQTLQPSVALPGGMQTLQPSVALPAPDTPDSTLDTLHPSASPTPLIVFDVHVDFDSDARPVSEHYEIGEDGDNNQYDPPNKGTLQDSSFNPVFVGAYYYPWHGNDFHNREGYLRKELLPQRHEPLLGEYDDSRPRVVSQHLSWSRQANIGLWATSWWGPGDETDQNTLRILDHNEIGDMKIALHYETFGRLGFNTTELTKAESDVEYMCDNYFGHSNYYRIDGRPVVFLYLSRVLDNRDHLPGVVFAMQSGASRCNEDVYIIGDQVFGEVSPDASTFFDASFYLDGITNYDIYGAMGRPVSNYAGKGTIDKYFKEQEEWKAVAEIHNCQYIPAVSPGYNDAGVRIHMNHPPLSRRLSPDAAEGSLFGYQIEQARKLVDTSNLLMVNSFNEWHEDTQIEPVVGNPTTEPILFTGGLEYVGYGDLYLEILRMGTKEGRSQMFDYEL